jgi:hypothetical protein
MNIIINSILKATNNQHLSHVRLTTPVSNMGHNELTATTNKNKTTNSVPR